MNQVAWGSSVMSISTLVMFKRQHLRASNGRIGTCTRSLLLLLPHTPVHPALFLFLLLLLLLLLVLLMVRHGGPATAESLDNVSRNAALTLHTHRQHLHHLHHSTIHDIPVLPPGCLLFDSFSLEHRIRQPSVEMTACLLQAVCF